MVEVVTFSKNNFMKKKVEVTKDPNLDAKYRDLFMNLDCFQSSFTIPVSKLLKMKDDSRFQNFSKGTKNVLINNKSTTKRLTSILNIINEANYVNQAHKVFFLMKDEEIIHMTQLILDTCTIQVFYINLFIRLLSDLMKTEHHIKVKNTINQFAKDFWDGKFMEMKSPNVGNQYDIFCSLQKHKTLCIARGVVVLHLLNDKMIDGDISEFDDFLRKQFKNIDQKVEDDQTRINTIDIILQIMIDAKNILGWDPKGVRVNFDSYITNNKTRFLCESLLMP